MCDEVYFKGVKIGTRIKPFMYGTLDGVNIDILYRKELKPCPCGNKATLIMDGKVAVRFGVFCTNPNCTECPTSYRYYWSWFHNATKAVDEWNKTIENLQKMVGENIQNEKITYKEGER